MKFHPLSGCLPILPGHELDELAQDIKQHGLKDPITLFEKKILDGRNRYLACKRAKVKARYEEFNGDPVAYVVSHNIARRHLDPSKRAAYILKLNAAAELWASRGRPKNVSQDTLLGDMAKTAGISRSTIMRARKVMKKAPDKLEQVAKGEKTVKEAAREVDQENKSNLDTMGFPIPEPAVPYWNRADEVRVILKQISKLKTLADELHERKDPMYNEVNLNYVHVELGNIYQAFKGALPYVVCTSCQGQLPETCNTCKGRGLISEYRWKHAIPVEARDMREKQIEKLSQKNN
jgi:ParB-like chromosome segregation protein Spo0J